MIVELRVCTVLDASVIRVLVCRLVCPSRACFVDCFLDSCTHSGDVHRDRRSKSPLDLPIFRRDTAVEAIVRF